MATSGKHAPRGFLSVSSHSLVPPKPAKVRLLQTARSTIRLCWADRKLFPCAQKHLSICRKLIWGFEGKTPLVVFVEFGMHFTEDDDFIACRQDSFLFPLLGFVLFTSAPPGPSTDGLDIRGLQDPSALATWPGSPGRFQCMRR